MEKFKNIGVKLRPGVSKFKSIGFSGIMPITGSQTLARSGSVWSIFCIFLFFFYCITISAELVGVFLALPAYFSLRVGLEGAEHPEFPFSSTEVHHFRGSNAWKVL